jgi:hypothetical protein
MPSKSFRLSVLTDCSFWSKIGVPDNRLIQQGLTLLLAAYLIRLSYNWTQKTQSLLKKLHQKSTFFSTVRNSFRQSLFSKEVVVPIPSFRQEMPRTKQGKMTSEGPRIKQPFEVFLVLDIEGTCDVGTNFDYPNEIIVRANDKSKKNYINNHPRNCRFVCCAGRTERTTAGQAHWNLLMSSGHLFDQRGDQCFLHFVHS